MSTVSPSAPKSDALKADSIWQKFNVHRVPPGKIVLTAFASYLIVALGWLGGSPIWLAFGLALIPWVPIMFVELEWTYKHYAYFVIFFAMVIVQAVHYSEHCIEVIQVHIFNTPVPQALAIFSKLNVEGVHFAGDSFLSLGTMLLLWKFPRNKWLWVAAPFQILHQSEHTFLFFEHVLWGYKAGGPGLLAYVPATAAHPALDGAWGGILNRPDLHWIYNTLFTVPFSIAFFHQLKITYDESLEEAFPEASQAQLIEATKHLETFNYVPGETVVSPGDLVDRLFVITDGEAEVIDNVNGEEVLVGTLTHGKVFGEHGLAIPGAVHDRTIRAKTPLSVLAMDKQTLGHLEERSQATPAKAMEAPALVPPEPPPATAPAV